MSFATGDEVRIAARAHQGHHRTPGYLKGKTGMIERIHERFPNPETSAYGAGGTPEQRLYLVAFDPRDIWSEYDGRVGDRILADVFEHWLEPAE